MSDGLPEVLAPAGNLEKLKTAVLYGADAVYIGGQRFGLRASADNFSEDEIATAVDFARRHGSRVYVAMNSYLHDSDFEGVGEFGAYLHKVGVSAAIVSDLGVMRSIRMASDLPVHLSTQASCLNSGSGQVWKTFGVERLILGRESSIKDAAAIREATGLEVELFIHGSMCMAYSGHCTISNFTAGRDSNRGGCIQSCRFDYKQTRGEEQAYTHFMSSKDLCGLELVPDFVNYGISSLKIEGRMKSLLYVATAASVYRRALDAYQAGTFEQVVPGLAAELEAVPHREYTEASLRTEAGFESIYSDNTPSSSLATRQLLGSVLETDASQMLVRLYRPVQKGMNVEVLPFRRDPVSYVVENLKSVDGRNLERARQDSVVWIDKPEGAETFNVVRVQG